ncbi:MAG: sensor histidine kinase KdpD [Acidobacteriota bacterium]
MEHRPDPDELLKQVQNEEARRKRGRLKIFFGAAPGVGKTYTMLEAARARRADGVDVVAGWAVTHGRAETEALLEGLEVLPPRILSYKGKELSEFDLDAALERRPALVLVDELAHSNAPGSRHAKRWQDVRELIEAGIDVYSTLNVQHIESLNDVVAQITGVSVRERVPDFVFADADEAELVDLPPDELLRRLREGKVYLPEEAERARDNFFRPGNLIALRELALRKTADRVDDQMQLYRREHAVRDTWPAKERVLVCLGPSPYGQRLVRAARMLAGQLRAEWIALYVETPGHAGFAPADREQLLRTMRLAEQLGAEVVTLSGEDTAEEVLHYARSRNVTKIVLGKPPRPRWMPGRSFVETIIRGSGGIDVHVIGGAAEERLARIRQRGDRGRALLRPYTNALATVAACALISLGLSRFVGPVNLVMVFLLGVVFVATRWGIGPAVLASVLGVASFDFCFVPPRWTFAVADTEYVLTFTVMLGVALVVSNLASRVRRQADAARERERQVTGLYRLVQDLASQRAAEGIGRATVTHLLDHAGLPSTVLVPAEDGSLLPLADSGGGAVAPKEGPVARWVFDHGESAGAGTDTLPGSSALYLPLQASQGVVGVLAVRNAEQRGPEFLHELELVAGQTALALERWRLAERARQSQIEVESERLRSSLLSAVSHDFRTPLASILGASTTLLGADLAGGDTRELVETIHEEAEHLHRLITNLLAVTRLESGKVDLHMEWQPLEEVVGAALGRLRDGLGGRPLVLDIPEDLPAVAIDAPLVEQVFINILENAAKYTPGGNPVEIHARGAGEVVEVQIADRGPGLPEEAVEKIFDKFYRASESRPGAGLGLAICQAIVRAHGGTIRAANRPGGGALFIFTLPVAPPIPEEARAGRAAKAEEEA